MIGYQPMQPPVPLRQNRAFTIFLIGQIISYVGDAILLLAMPLLVLEITGSVSQMGLITTTIGLGQVIGGLLAGNLVDRLDRRRLMVATDVIRVVLYALVPLAWYVDMQEVWVLHVVSFFGSMAGTCFFIAQLAALPSLVDTSQLTAANGRMMAGYGASMFLGPFIGGVLCSTIGPSVTIGVDALTFMVSALSLSMIRFRAIERGGEPESVESDDERAGGDRHALRFVGVRFLWREPTLRAVALLMMGAALLVAGGNDLFIFHLKANLGQSDEAVGAVLGIGAFGAMIGGLSSASMRGRFGFGVALLGILFVQGACVVLIGLSANVYVVALGAAGFAMAGASGLVHANSIRQELTPDRLLGRVTAVFSVATSGIGPLGAAGTTFLAEFIGTANVLIIIGACLLVLGVVGLSTPARHRAPEMDPAALTALQDPSHG